jgi:hypothetical protein
LIRYLKMNKIMIINRYKIIYLKILKQLKILIGKKNYTMIAYVLNKYQLIKNYLNI